MKWRFDDLLTFMQVMENGSITTAAARLNLSKSVVSKRIADLEAALGVELFQRSTRLLKPTESAQALYDEMCPLVLQMQDAAERVSSPEHALQGRLRITAPMSFGTMYLNPVVLDFARRHPSLELVLDLDDRMVDIIRSAYDVGVRIGTLQDSNLIARKLCMERRIVCCSPDYARRRGLPETIADLATHECIDYAHRHTGQLWQFENRSGPVPLSVMLHSRIITNNGETIRDAAIAGLGVALLPLFMISKPLQEGTLIPVLPHETPLSYTISVVYPPTRHVAAKVRAFIDHLAAAFPDPPPWEKDLRGVAGFPTRDDLRRITQGAVSAMRASKA